MFVLDTDTCIYLIEGRAPGAAARLRTLEPSDISVTAITAAELYYCAMHSARAEANTERVRLFLQPLEILPFGIESALEFGRLKQHLTTQGQPIGPMDLLIAATAIAADSILVTNNTREFARVPHLTIENWVPSAP